MRSGECDRRVFGPIAIALRNGPHEAASVREVSRVLSKLILGRDATGESSSAIAKVRWAAHDGLRAVLHPDEAVPVGNFEQAVHPHAANSPVKTLRARKSTKKAEGEVSVSVLRS